ncbi:unnamed protein product, partial [Candidula unifasciata]
VVGRVAEPAVMPYYLFALTYMVVYSPFSPHPAESAIAALLKTVPLWYLTIYTYRRRAEKLKPLRALKTSPGSADLLSKEEATRISVQKTGFTIRSLGYFIASLLVSSLGDICLVYKHLFMPGIFCFSIVHVFNVLSLRRHYATSCKAWLSVPLCLLLYSVVLSVLSDTVFLIIVFLYAVLIHSMLFFAIAGYESCPCPSTLSSMLGASLFVLSDFLIACDKWWLQTPYCQLSILLAYYMAQLLLAVGDC